MAGETRQTATPGPWEASVLGSEGYAVMGPPYEGRPGRRRVARCGDTDWEQDKANAHLIAATPDLLALVERLAKADLGCYGDCRFHSNLLSKCLSCQAIDLLSHIGGHSEGGRA